MKNYRMLSKVMLAFCACGIALAIVNGCTGVINASVQAGGTAVCIAGFGMAGIAVILLENQRIK